MTDADDPDIRAFIEALRPLQVRAEGPYKPIDRYRDFSRVFGTDEGKRVLSQIIDLCEGKPPSDAEIASHALLAKRAGMRFVGQKIAFYATVAPRDA